jgi:hypothetical protein
MGLGGLLLDLSGVGRGMRGPSRDPDHRAAPSPLGAAPGFFDALAEVRHERLFSDPLGIPKTPQGFRAEDVSANPALEGFVPVEEAARRMEISEDAVLELARSAYLLARWHRGRLLVRPGIL